MCPWNVFYPGENMFSAYESHESHHNSLIDSLFFTEREMGLVFSYLVVLSMENTFPAVVLVQ